MAGSWSGLMKIYLGREREKRKERDMDYDKSLSNAKPSVTLFPFPEMKPRTGVTRYMPSYRLEPRNPFNREQCENIMKSIVDNLLENFIYTSDLANKLSVMIGEQVRQQVKDANFDRYKYICIVTIGEKLFQGFDYVTTFLWDGTKDGHVKYAYDTPDFFAIVILYYIYYD